MSSSSSSSESSSSSSTGSSSSSSTGSSSSSGSDSAGVIKAEIYSFLNDVYSSLGGSDWNVNTNWGDQYVSYCDWYGVDCDDSSTRRVSLLSLADNNLSGTFPASIPNVFSSLRVLILDDNNITGEFPASISNLKDLEYLSITNNQITGTVPQEVCDLRDINGGFLQTLDVDCVEYSGSVSCDCCLFC